VTSQLIDATSGAHVWAERYDAAATDLKSAGKGPLPCNLNAAGEPDAP